MNYIIFGATTQISIELICLIKREDKNAFFFLSSRNLNRLKEIPIICDLKKGYYKIYNFDLTNDDSRYLDSLTDEIKIHLKKENLIYFFPSIPNLKEGKLNTQKLDKILNLNFKSPIKIFNSIIKNLNNTKNITYTSSASCIRAKSKNYVYASSKLGVERYLSSLTHYFGYKKPFVQIFRLGFINNKKLDSTFNFFFTASPKSIAEYIFLMNKKNTSNFFYFPRIVYLLKYLIILIPRFIYKKIKY